VVLICTMLDAGVFSFACFGLWVSGLVFSLNVLDESGCGFRATLVSNNRERTEDMAKDVVEGYEGVASSLGQDNSKCLSGAV
jgi:hypothetical protein